MYHLDDGYSFFVDNLERRFVRVSIPSGDIHGDCTLLDLDG